ncbi:MAG TPA: hypothetical protein DCZ94_10900 [Lentisphaeria bacterium]|nr:MAG: hypothetical protein A2X48_06780 [Lentisphaerae bacterium GWF2_49_21]HBC87453.1 hypothetical protein [Lentisphaeria bacterium]
MKFKADPVIGKLNPAKIKHVLQGEDGVALIAVLGMLVIISILTMSAVTVSQICRYSAVTFNDRSRAAYVAEGAASRVQWLVMSDRRRFTNRVLGEADYTDETQERFMADGILHKMDYYGVETDVMIFDMASGFDISDDTPARQLDTYRTMFSDDEERRNAFVEFQDCLADYVDANDFAGIKGKEKADYQKLGLDPLPRNGRFQYREEIMLVPGFEQFFSVDSYGRLSSFRIIPPLNMPRIRQNNSFFSASREIIMNKCSFSSGQVDKVIEARDKWINKGIPLNENLDPGIVSSLKNSFSFSESGFYTIIVEASAGPGRSKRAFATSVQIQDRINQGIRYYEQILY